MVPPSSHKISRVSWYSFGLIIFRFRLRDCYLLWLFFPDYSTNYSYRLSFWALSCSLAATWDIEFSFFSSGYLDVSVRRVRFSYLFVWVWDDLLIGFPHSDICGSLDICSFPQLFAACHVLLRLLVPRHPPNALFFLTFVFPVNCLFFLLIRLFWLFFWFFLNWFVVFMVL